MNDSSNSKPLELEDRVWALYESGDMRNALATCQALNERYPKYGPGWRSASQLALKINQPSIALAAIEKALALDADNDDWLLQKAVCLNKLGATKLVKPILDSLRGANRFSNAYQYSTFALLLSYLNQHKEALSYYEKSRNLEPNDAQHYYNIASTQRFMGDFEAAKKNYNKAIELNPNDYEAYRLRSELNKQAEQENNIAQLKSILETRKLQNKDKAQLAYALSKECEDLNDYDNAFHYLKIGADARRASIQYDANSDLKTIEIIRNVFSADFFNKRTDVSNHEYRPDKTPIFILGLPRTGTTLVERIVSNHSDVVSAGELNNFSIEMLRQIRAKVGPKNISKEDLVPLSTSLDFPALGQAYIESVKELAGDSPYFIDKLPLNYLYIGLIHLALPDAKIICLNRHPLDACYSIYKQFFKDAYPFSYDLKELGQYYLAYRRLMEHWNKVLPNIVHTVNYEDLVDDVEQQAQQILGHCGLRFQPQCIDFYNNKAASTTASAVQVRQKIYTSSVGRWKHLRKHLAPLIETLKEGGLVFEEE